MQELSAMVRSPGDFIRDELTARGWTQTDLAQILGRPLPTLNRILQGKHAILPEMAIRSERLSGTVLRFGAARSSLPTFASRYSSRQCRGPSRKMFEMCR